MIRRGLILGATATLFAAFWTYVSTDPWHWPWKLYFNWLTGFFPPHRGYSAYIVTILIFLAPYRWLRGLAGAEILLSNTRAAWAGVVVGWAFGKPRRLLVAAGLVALIVVGGRVFKPAHIAHKTDNIRVQIWKTSLHLIKTHPQGIGKGNFCVGVAGREVTKTHSDALQILVERGIIVGGGVILLILAGVYLTPRGPAKAALVCLLAQSVVDNRLHHWACVTALVLTWIVALTRSGRAPRV